MYSRLLAIASQVIEEAAPQDPADAVLRRKLRAQPDWTCREGAEVSRAVFAYYRWFGWGDRKQPIGEQIARSLELAEKFQRQPGAFKDAELLERAVPAWAKDEIEISGNWLRAIQAQPKLWLRARPGQGGALALKLGACRRFRAGLDILEYQGSEDLFRRPEFHRGEFEIQDISSQGVGLICDPKPGESWWDVCAGEGGKLLHLSDLMKNQGLIWASDRAAWRLARLKRRAARAKAFNYRSRLWDGSSALPTKTRFDGVLVDAPCTGVGTWQRNPHARWTTTVDDVKELSEIQKGLLDRVAPAVKTGGRLLYAVCSLARPETEEVRDAFEQRFPEFERLTFKHPLNDKPPRDEVWFWPQEHGGNGMFVAGWRRRRD
jgi:16S rRNA (cytosine967-C5)-methyltransferase